MTALTDYDRIIRSAIPQALVPVSGTWFRYVQHRHANNPRPWAFSATYPSRFYDDLRQPPLCHLYLAETDPVAQLESRSLFQAGTEIINNPMKNTTQIKYDVTLKHVFNLPSIMPALLTAQEQTGDWEGYNG